MSEALADRLEGVRVDSGGTTQFFCDIEGCPRPGPFKTPQALGLHKRQTHGIKGSSPGARSRQKRAKTELKTTPVNELPTVFVEDEKGKKIPVMDFKRFVLCMYPNGSVPVNRMAEVMNMADRAQELFRENQT